MTAKGVWTPGSRMSTWVKGSALHAGCEGHEIDVVAGQVGSTRMTGGVTGAPAGMRVTGGTSDRPVAINRLICGYPRRPQAPAPVSLIWKDTLSSSGGGVCVTRVAAIDSAEQIGKTWSDHSS